MKIKWDPVLKLKHLKTLKKVKKMDLEKLLKSTDNNLQSIFDACEELEAQLREHYLKRNALTQKEFKALQKRLFELKKCWNKIYFVRMDIELIIK